MDRNTRLATTIPENTDALVREMAARHRAPISVITTALLGYALDNSADDDFRRRLETAVEEYRVERAEIGRMAMSARYGKDDANAKVNRSSRYGKGDDHDKENR